MKTAKLVFQLNSFISRIFPLSPSPSLYRLPLRSLCRPHIRNLRRIFKHEPEAQADGCAKVIKLLSLAGSDRDVADPWYTGNFDVTYEDVLAGCEALLKQL